MYINYMYCCTYKTMLCTVQTMVEINVNTKLISIK